MFELPPLKYDPVYSMILEFSIVEKDQFGANPVISWF